MMRGINGRILSKAVALICVFVMLCAAFAACAPKCEHDYVQGKCTICGYACEHKTYENERCTECFTRCRHTEYKDGACVACGKECSHTAYRDGVCTVCGTQCEHKYVYSRCSVCQKDCTHNFVGNECADCGGEKFVDSVKDAKYDYQPHLSEQLPRVDVVTTSGNNNWATQWHGLTDGDGNPQFDNNNPANNYEWPYNDCTVTVSNCDEKYELSEIKAGIKVRGNWTTTYPKKPFRIKFEKKQGMLGLNGGNKFKSWVLLADYKDCSLERNSLAFYLGQQILGSDGYYCSDFRQVNLYLNGAYWGVYLLAEQQQVNSGRIDVTEPEDGYKGTDIGYFIEFDGYYNLEIYNERFSLDYNGVGGPLKTRDGETVYPTQNGFAIKNDIYDLAQKQFIKSYTANVYKICYEAVYNRKFYTFNDNYTALVEYKPKTTSPVQETVYKIMDIQSLVDTYIMNEIACDYDIGWSSFFMDVDMSASGDKILRFQAPWDFDSAFGLRDVCVDGTGLYAANKDNPWLLLFINEDWFWNKVKDKWQQMNAANVQKNALQFITTLRTSFTSSYTQNFGKWGFVVNGESNWQAAQVKNQKEASDYLYSWLNKRFNYLNTVWL